MELLIITSLLALLIYGLQHNHTHHLAPRSPLFGSTPVQDRDTERLLHDLQTHP